MLRVGWWMRSRPELTAVMLCARVCCVQLCCSFLLLLPLCWWSSQRLDSNARRFRPFAQAQRSPHAHRQADGEQQQQQQQPREERRGGWRDMLQEDDVQLRP